MHKVPVLLFIRTEQSKRSELNVHHENAGMMGGKKSLAVLFYFVSVCAGVEGGLSQPLDNLEQIPYPDRKNPTRRRLN